MFKTKRFICIGLLIIMNAFLLLSGISFSSAPQSPIVLYSEEEQQKMGIRLLSYTEFSASYEIVSDAKGKRDYRMELEGDPVYAKVGSYLMNMTPSPGSPEEREVKRYNPQTDNAEMKISDEGKTLNVIFEDATTVSYHLEEAKAQELIDFIKYGSPAEQWDWSLG